AGAVQQQLSEVLRNSAEAGEGGPDDDRDGDDVDAAPTLGEPCDRKPERRVKERERQSAENAEFRIRQFEIDFDRLSDGRDDRAVDEVQRVRHYEQTQHGTLV